MSIKRPMAKCVGLDLNYNGVPRWEWEKAYEESIILLKAFPVPLMDHQIKNLMDSSKQSKYICTKNFVNTEYDYWTIDTDMATRKHGSPFNVYKDQLDIAEDECPDLRDRDVLYAREKDIDEEEGYGSRVFCEDTKGYPYYYAILAVGILFADRLPYHCYVYGHFDSITLWDVEHVVAWINSVLDNPVAMPVNFDAEKLWERIDQIYKDKFLAAKRFLRICGDSSRFKVLLEHINKAVLKELFIEEINNYRSLENWPASYLVIDWINATNDVRELIDMLCMPPGRTKFDLLCVLTVLCENCITFTSDDKAYFSTLAEQRADLDDLEYEFLSFIPFNPKTIRFIEFYIPVNELIAIFNEYEGGVKEVISHLANKRHAQIEYLMDERRKEIEKIEQYSIPGLDIHAPDLFLIKEIKNQEIHFDNIDERLVQFGAQLKKFSEENHEEISACIASNNIPYHMIQYSRKNSIWLSEEAWEIAETLVDPELSKMILTVFAIKNIGPDFEDWRLYVLENHDLWDRLLEQYNC